MHWCVKCFSTCLAVVAAAADDAESESDAEVDAAAEFKLANCLIVSNNFDCTLAISSFFLPARDSASDSRMPELASSTRFCGISHESRVVIVDYSPSTYVRLHCHILSPYLHQ
jgi:hypothetical protein